MSEITSKPKESFDKINDSNKPDSDIALEVINLRKNFGRLTAVNNISFKIAKGSIVGILGPNGAGKTTTIRLITGIFELPPESHVKVFSNDSKGNYKRIKKYFGIVPEISNAYSDFTVWQNLMFSGVIYGLSKNKIAVRANKLLKRFGLEEKKNAKSKTLSKGLKQRLNLCMALLHEPPILILDEPLSGLDPFSVNIVRNQILQLRKEGKTILITTHNMQEARRICDRILIINRGKIIADQTPENLLKKIKPFSKLIFVMNRKLSDNQLQHLENEFQGHSNIQHQIKGGNSVLTIKSIAPLKDTIKFNSFLESQNLSILTFKAQESTLEEVFIYLIKKDSLQGGKKQ